MGFTIVTVTNKRRSFAFDLELPDDKKVKNLVHDIVETLESYDPTLVIPSSSRIYFIDGKRELLGNETLNDACVWEGSELCLI